MLMGGQQIIPVGTLQKGRSQVSQSFPKLVLVQAQVELFKGLCSMYIYVSQPMEVE